MVYRIGIVGSDNSHAITFSQIANGIDRENYVLGFKATHIFGFDEKRNREVAEKGGIENIVSDVNEMIGKIDIAFVVFRHGGLHLEYAKPFIESGTPVFVDKPLAATVADAKKIIQLAKERQTLLMSFSTLRFTDTVQELKGILKNEEPVFLSVLGPGDLESEYGGLIFYGIHCAEIFNEVAGTGVKEVHAVAKGKSIVATLVHEKLIGTIKISPEIPYVFSVEGLTKKTHFSAKVDSKDCYKKGMIKIKEMLDRKQWILSEGEMLEPVAVIKAIEESIRESSKKPISASQS
ncbi:MAG: Gfo/Idh/MocA family oxidoreductase [Candidatus Brockarchaeota archaeon]|nr:Gfo/Idh/MocA family oxidoreductase [Candidatus Brockarchaeota archaeon]